MVRRIMLMMLLAVGMCRTAQCSVGDPSTPLGPMAATPGSPTTPARSTLLLRVEDTKAFFERFISTGEVSPRGKFETRESYQKRLPPPFDSNKIVYFTVSSGGPYYDFLHDPYDYDMDTQKFTAFAGHLDRQDSLPTYPGADKGTPIIIYEKKDKEDTYPATNRFGVAATVDRSYYSDYVLNFSNLDQCPAELYDSASGIFKITIARSPKVAERLSKNFEVIVGVKLPGYSHSGFGYFHTEPTIDKPIETFTLRSQIDAEMMKVILRDKSSGEVLAEYSIVPRPH
jgi:hypothetical protein